MPLDTDTLTSLKAALGDGNSALYDTVAGNVATDAAEADRLASVTRGVTKKFDDLKTTHKATAADRDKFKADFEAASSDDALGKLTTARDKAATDGAEWKTKFEGLQQKQHFQTVSAKLVSALFTDDEGKPVEASALRREAAGELLLGKGIPEGVELDDKGNLVGHVAVLKTFREKWGTVLTASDAGDDTGNAGANTGPRIGNDVKPKTKPNTKKDARTIAREEGAAMATAYMDQNQDPYRRVAATK